MSENFNFLPLFLMANFSITSARQKNFILGGLVVALVALFLPAISLSMGPLGSISVSTFDAWQGKLAFFVFLIAGVIIFNTKAVSEFLAKNANQKVNDAQLTFYALIAVFVVSVLVLWMGIDAVRTLGFGMLGFGYYILILSLAFTVACVFMFDKVDSVAGNVANTVQSATQKKSETSTESTPKKTRAKKETSSDTE